MGIYTYMFRDKSKIKLINNIHFKYLKHKYLKLKKKLFLYILN